MITFVVPCYNASVNLNFLYASLKMQSNDNWRVIFVDDVSNDNDTRDILKKIAFLDTKRVTVVLNEEKKYALRNIVETVSNKNLVANDDIVAIIDGDDSLCNENTVSLLNKEFSVDEVSVVWTAHRWDVNNLNVSRDLPKGINPYQYEWCSSHLKSFRASALRAISIENFKDANGQWFQRGYDQALMLPLLYVAKARVYVPVVCYNYNINSTSLPQRDWSERKQLSTINFVRARGFLR